MAEVTTPDELPFAEPDDDNDAPGFMQALAERIQVVITALRSAFVPITREIETGIGLTGGGALDEDLELAVNFAEDGVPSSVEAVRADDVRLANARPPTAHNHGARLDVFPSFGGLDLTISAAATPTTVFSQAITVPDPDNEYLVTVELDLSLAGTTAADQPVAEVSLEHSVDAVTSVQKFRVPVAGTVQLGTHREWLLADLHTGTLTVKVTMTLPGGATAGQQNVKVNKANSHMIIERTKP